MNELINICDQIIVEFYFYFFFLQNDVKMIVFRYNKPEKEISILCVYNYNLLACWEVFLRIVIKKNVIFKYVIYVIYVVHSCFSLCLSMILI